MTVPWAGSPSRLAGSTSVTRATIPLCSSCERMNGRIGLAAGVGRRLAAVDGPPSFTRYSRDILPPGRRFSDGIIDSVRRPIVGSLSIEGPSMGTHCFDFRRTVFLRRSMTICNLQTGPAFSRWPHSLCCRQPRARHVLSRLSSRIGGVGKRREFAGVDGAEPEVTAVDADGNLWVVLWRGHGIRKFVTDGAMCDIDVGPPDVTSLCFLGPHTRRAVVTTESLALNPA